MGTGVVVGPSRRVHDLAGARGIAARRGIGLAVAPRIVVCLGIAIVGCIGGAGAVTHSGEVADLAASAGQRLAACVGADGQPKRQTAEERLVPEQGCDAVADPAGRFLTGTAGHHAASRCVPAPSPKYPRTAARAHRRHASLGAARWDRSWAMAAAVGSGALAIRSFTSWQSCASRWSPKMLRRGTTSTRSRTFEIIESRNTRGLAAVSRLQAFGNTLHGFT